MLIKMKKVYAFLFCDGPDEGYSTISVHKTKKGAFKAMNKYINEQCVESRERMGRYYRHMTHFGYWEGWCIREFKVLK